VQNGGQVNVADTLKVWPTGTVELLGSEITAGSFIVDDANGGTFTHHDGTLTIDGTSATTVDIEADLTALESDSGFRDGALGNQALETNTFPMATFRLTEPIDFGAVPEEGTVLKATAVGDLNLHGVVKQVEIPIEAQLVGNAIAVTGVAPVLFADFDIDPPSARAVASVEDNGTIEIQLFFSRER
ncbi:MAG: YceI family protein, partial [Acidimicrobiales bacterium]